MPVETVMDEPKLSTEAKKIVDAFALPENKGKGVISLDGRMIEIMHADIAARTVALGEAIKAKA